MADALFDDEYHRSPDAIAAAKALANEQFSSILVKVHPLNRLELHGRADIDPAPDDPPDLPFRCGTCQHRTGGRWPKCDVSHRNGKPETDVRSWWPACILYEPAAAA